MLPTALCAAALAALASAGQDALEPREPANRADPRATDDSTLQEAQRRFQSEVSRRVQEAARKLDVRVDDQELVISLSSGGLVAGAASLPAPGTRLRVGGGERGLDDDPGEPGDPGEMGDRGDLRSADDPRRPGMNGNGDASVVGVVILTGDLRRQRAGGVDDLSADRRDGQDRTAAQAASFGAYRVVCPPGSDTVELHDESGRAALRFPLLDVGPEAPSTLEAGAGRVRSRDAGEQGEREPRAGEREDRENEGQARPGSMAIERRGADRSTDWTTVYASVVFGLTNGRQNGR